MSNLYAGITETAFSKLIVTFLRQEYAMVQRIETGRTGRGVPDIYYVRDGNQIWLELKSAKYKFMGYIDWRVGQLNWAANHFIHMENLCRCFTIANFTDTLVLIPMTSMVYNIQDNQLPIGSFTLCNTIRQCFDLIDHILEEEIENGKVYLSGQN